MTISCTRCRDSGTIFHVGEQKCRGRNYGSLLGIYLSSPHKKHLGEEFNHPPIYILCSSVYPTRFVRGWNDMFVLIRFTRGGKYPLLPPILAPLSLSVRTFVVLNAKFHDIRWNNDKRIFERQSTNTARDHFLAPIE